MSVSFDLGQIVATPAVLQAFKAAGDDPAAFLERHRLGYWGDCSPDDWLANERALKTGERIFSVYHLKNKIKIWIITDAAGDDGTRASTCILLPDDY